MLEKFYNDTGVNFGSNTISFRFFDRSCHAVFNYEFKRANGWTAKTAWHRYYGIIRRCFKE